MLARWAEIMTGAKPKSHFLKPGLMLPILGGLARTMLRPPDRAAELAAFQNAR